MHLFHARHLLTDVREERKQTDITNQYHQKETHSLMNESKKVSWITILQAIIQAAIAALTALGVTSCTTLLS